MTVRYLDQNDVVQTISTVTRVQPVATLELLIETASTKTVIKVTQLVDIV